MDVRRAMETDCPAHTFPAQAQQDNVLYPPLSHSKPVSSVVHSVPHLYISVLLAGVAVPEREAMTCPTEGACGSEGPAQAEGWGSWLPVQC